VSLNSIKGASTVVMLVTTSAFVVVLFLGWHRTTIDVAGVATVHTEEMGWSGWGWLAGSAAFTLLLANLNRLRRGLEPDAAFGITDLLLGTVLVSATVAAVFSGESNVQVGTVGFESGTILWPAWVGLVLAWVVEVAAVLVALPQPWQPERRLPESIARGT
jgi:hypothetical protein